jgi:hypothetical protein
MLFIHQEELAVLHHPFNCRKAVLRTVLLGAALFAGGIALAQQPAATPKATTPAKSSTSFDFEKLRQESEKRSADWEKARNTPRMYPKVQGTPETGKYAFVGTTWASTGNSSTRYRFEKEGVLVIEGGGSKSLGKWKRTGNVLHFDTTTQYASAVIDGPYLSVTSTNRGTGLDKPFTTRFFDTANDTIAKIVNEKTASDAAAAQKRRADVIAAALAQPTQAPGQPPLGPPDTARVPRSLCLGALPGQPQLAMNDAQVIARANNQPLPEVCVQMIATKDEWKQALKDGCAGRCR